jgi:hypothetical protein
MLLTLDEIELLFNDMKPKIRIERILGTTEDGWVGTKEIPILVHLRLFSRSLVAGVAQVANMVDQLPEELSLLGKHVRESGWMGGLGRSSLLLLLLLLLLFPPESFPQFMPVPERKFVLAII